MKSPSIRKTCLLVFIFLSAAPIVVFEVVNLALPAKDRATGGIEFVIFLILVFFFLIVGIFSALIFSRLVLKPVTRADDSVSDLMNRHHDGSGEKAGRFNEIQRLASSINDELVPIVGRTLSDTRLRARTSGVANVLVKDYSKDIWNIGDGITRDIKDILDEMSGVDGQIANVYAAVTQILATIESLILHIGNQSSAVTQTSAALEEMTASINSIARISEEKSKLKDALIETVNNGRQKIRDSDNQIREISADVDGITSVIGVINGIAAQTNMLAMNAAIEAAHAGQYGRGFSVVADEIRKLAESAAANSKVIGDFLRKVNGKMENILHAEEDSEESFADVVSKVAEFVNAFTEITQSTREMSAGSKEIVTSAGLLTQVSQDISHGSSEIGDSAKGISESVAALKDSYGVVTERVSVIDSRARDIIQAQEDMTHIIDWGDSNIQKIDKGLDRFDLSCTENGAGQSQTAFVIGNLLLECLEWITTTGSAIRGLVVPEDGAKIDADKAKDYEGCKMGQWLNGEGRRLFGGKGIFAELVEDHLQFHEDIVRTAFNVENASFNESFGTFRMARARYNAIVTKSLELLREIS